MFKVKRNAYRTGRRQRPFFHKLYGRHMMHRLRSHCPFNEGMMMHRRHMPHHWREFSDNMGAHHQHHTHQEEWI